MRIFYLAPNNEKPSWGFGILAEHVQILNQNGFNASFIMENAQFPGWLKINIPIYNFEYLKENITLTDILVVPEVMVNVRMIKEIKSRKVLIVQASAYLFEAMPEGEDHKSLGFERVIYIMPHMLEIISRHIDLPSTLIQPFIADSFFKSDEVNRKRQVLLFPKFQQIDYSIVRYLLERHIKSKNKSWFNNLIYRDNWIIKELIGYKHEEVVDIMKESAFFVSLNSFEALNTSVMEAMASGCIVFCYQGFGPADYLKNNINARVFPNNEAYKLVEALCEEIDSYDTNEKILGQIRTQGYATASRYTRLLAGKDLVRFFSNFSEAI